MIDIKQPTARALALLGIAALPALAESQAEERLIHEGAPQRIDRLQETLTREHSDGPSWLDHIEIGGLIEVEAASLKPFAGGSESDLRLATFELGILAQVNPWVSVEASLLYEQDETDLEVDLAFINIHNPEVSPVFFTAGQFYVPFGDYETNLVSDPLTLEIGEAREVAARLGFLHNGFNGSLYAFKADNQVRGEDRIASWGANLGYALETDAYELRVGAGYINDLGDSNSLQDAVFANRREAYAELVEDRDPRARRFSIDPTERTGGWSAHLGLTVGDFNIIAEYLTAGGRFDADSLSYRDRGAEPAAWNLELGYSFPVFGRDSTAAISYQGSREAVNLELPKKSWLLGWSVDILDNTSLAFEYRRDWDYHRRDGGTGRKAHALVAQLAVAF